MDKPELNEKNLNRIYRINWVISGPLLVIFIWPYLLLADVLEMNTLYAAIGGFFFAVPFALTVIHGHISIALGTLHRDLYYNWQKRQVGIYKWAFNPIFFTTKMRLFMIIVSIAFLVIGLFT
jgi:hypothetical protein